MERRKKQKSIVLILLPSLIKEEENRSFVLSLSLSLCVSLHLSLCVSHTHSEALLRACFVRCDLVHV